LKKKTPLAKSNSTGDRAGKSHEQLAQVNNFGSRRERRDLLDHLGDFFSSNGVEILDLLGAKQMNNTQFLKLSETLIACCKSDVYPIVR